MKHKHAELIKLWADGAQIQCFNDHYSQWQDTTPVPYWLDDIQYRIKPDEKKPVVMWLWANVNGSLSTEFYSEEDMIKNGYPEQWIRLDWSRTEFPE